MMGPIFYTSFQILIHQQIIKTTNQFVVLIALLAPIQATLIEA